MPFTLAHPAAVLPLRRACPRYLSFPALIVGSLVPDLGYLLERFNVDAFTHQLIWSQALCVPTGLLLVWTLHHFGPHLIKLLPSGHRERLSPLCQRPLGSPLAIVFSLLLGVWTHLAWDAFTHKDGWLVENISLLRVPVLSWGSRRLRMFHLFSYGTAFFGVAWLALAYQNWAQATTGARRATPGATLRRALLVGALMLPIGLTHHVLRYTLILVTAMIVAVWVVMRFILRDSTNSEPRAPGSSPKS